MVFSLSVIAGGIAGLAGSLIKHPLVTKMLIFSFFIGFIGYVIDYIKYLIPSYIFNNSLFAVASYMGLLDALSLYITIIVAGFGVKQVLAFIRS